MKNAIVSSALTTQKRAEERVSLFKKIERSLKNSSLLKALWQNILYSTVRSNEPRLWQKCDRKGNIYWVVYDPATNCTTTFSSEREVRIWLDTRYYL